MHSADGIGGFKSWHKLGDSFSIENPQWLNRYGLTPEMINVETGDYTGRMPTLEKVSLTDCVELSQIHSRELQDQIEDLYLAALDVSFERFQFNVRYLGVGGGEPSASLNGAIVPHGPGDQSTLGAAFGISQLLPAGGQVAVELANNTLWLFSGPNQTNSASVLSYSLVQPLLAGAGRKVVMENLTQSERNLLYQARTLARFRQSLFTNVVSDGSGSYLNLIQQTQVIRNQQENIERLRNQVAILQSNSGQKGNLIRADLDWEEQPEGLVFPDALHGKMTFDQGRKLLIWNDNVMSPEEQAVLEKLAADHPGDNAFRNAIQEIIQTISVVPSPLDVLQLQGNLASAINQLRSLERAFQDSLDSLKLSLGLPPDLVMTIDDRMLEPFTVIDPELKTLETEVTNFIRVWAQIDDDAPTTEQLLTTNAAFGQLVERVEREGFAVLDQDMKNLELKFESRLADLENEEDRQRVKLDVERDLRLLNDARGRLTVLKQATSALTDEIRLLDDAQPAPKNADELFADEMTPAEMRRLDILTGHQQLLQISRSLLVVQIGLRVEQITVPEFEMPLDDVIEFAVEGRVDLMNQKAVVMDARRKMEIAANQLLSNVDVIVDGDIRTSGGNKPFDFRGSKSQLRAGLRFTAPLDQINERNNYRASQIDYQRARRDYMALEDQVKQQVRRNWRQLSVLKRNLETSRLQLRLAARQYESAVDESTAPTQTGTGGGTRTGVQGTNLIQALNSVVSAQNSLIQNWITYEQNRLGIYRDMGMMEIGADGIWNDPQYRGTQDRDTPEGLPGRQNLPNDGPDHGPEKALPDLDNPLGARGTQPGRSRLGGEAATDEVVLTVGGVVED
jgi:outer membrane protein TolC